jgi:hypothetical protein
MLRSWTEACAIRPHNTGHSRLVHARANIEVDRIIQRPSLSSDLSACSGKLLMFQGCVPHVLVQAMTRRAGRPILSDGGKRPAWLVTVRIALDQRLLGLLPEHDVQSAFISVSSHACRRIIGQSSRRTCLGSARRAWLLEVIQQRTRCESLWQDRPSITRQEYRKTS